MPTRLNYAAPFARQLVLSAGRRLRPGGLAATLPDSDDGEPFVIVTGPGRSGTSAVARVLHESGVKMGENFREPTEINPVGFYEELPVCELNDRIMKESGIRGLQRWPWRTSLLAVADRYGGAMDGLVAGTSADGWKDPRFSVTLEAWLPHLPSRPKIVLCLRSPEAFVRSVTRIYGLVSREPVEEFWANELRRLLDVIKDYHLDATCIQYDHLVARPEEAVSALSAFVGRSLDPAYVEPDLRRFKYAVPRRHAALYQEALAIASGQPAGERPTAWGLPAPTAPRQHGEALSEAEARAIDEYLHHVRAIDARVEASKAGWVELVGGPQFRLVRHQELGLDLSEILERTHEASAALVEALSEVQAELGSIVPPAVFEDYHELTRAAVDGERLVAQLVLHASGSREPDRQAINSALEAWRLTSSPEASAKVKKRRSQEYERAIEASGYRTGRRESEQG